MSHIDTNETIIWPQDPWKDHFETSLRVTTFENWIVFGASIFQLLVLAKLTWDERAEPTLKGLIKAALKR
ncbi:hypothetical protein HDU99_010456, partial [Rhizoclosmatium hyalinum]